MPIYEYECQNCGNKFTINCSMSEVKQAVNCGKCKHVAYKKLPTKVNSNVRGSSGKKGYYNSHWR